MAPDRRRGCRRGRGRDRRWCGTIVASSACSPGSRSPPPRDRPGPGRRGHVLGADPARRGRHPACPAGGARRGSGARRHRPRLAARGARRRARRPPDRPRRCHGRSSRSRRPPATSFGGRFRRSCPGSSRPALLLLVLGGTVGAASVAWSRVIVALSDRPVDPADLALDLLLFVAIWLAAIVLAGLFAAVRGAVQTFEDVRVSGSATGTFGASAQQPSGGLVRPGGGGSL